MDRTKLAALALLKGFLDKDASSSGSGSGSSDSTREQQSTAASLAAALSPSLAARFEVSSLLTVEERLRRNDAKIIVEQLYGPWPPPITIATPTTTTTTTTTSPPSPAISTSGHPDANLSPVSVSSTPKTTSSSSQVMIASLMSNYKCGEKLVGGPLTEPRGVAEAAQTKERSTIDMTNTTVTPSTSSDNDSKTSGSSNGGDNVTALTYGEMDHDSFIGIIDRMIALQTNAIASSLTSSATTPTKVVSQKQKPTFVDLGSGVFKTIFTAALSYNFDECIGVEIIRMLIHATSRHQKYIM
jgi:hypothetical protein